MSPEIEWIIEHDDFPPDQVPWPLPPPPPRQRRPGRLWLLVGLTLLSAILVYWLWQLGGRPPPNPQPDEPKQAAIQLEAAVQLEISALNSGDEEIFERLQDTPTRRQNFQPPRDLWFGDWLPSQMHGETRGEMRLLEAQLLDEKSARALVELDWQGESYQFNWFYRKQGDRWLHTDGANFDRGPLERLSSPHLSLTCAQTEAPRLEPLLSQLEDFVTELCDLLTCPTGNFTIQLETTLVPRYSAWRQSPSHVARARIQPMTGQLAPVATVNGAGLDLRSPYYNIPSPLSIRWPSDGRPEPLLLASLGRHIIHDLYVEPLAPNLSQENQAALTVTAFWLAHHLLDMESPPTTQWIDTAANGKEQVVALMQALADDLSIQTALATVLEPAGAQVALSPDFFSMLILIANPTRTVTHFNQAPFLHESSLLEQLDSATPWPTAFQPNYRFLPHITYLKHTQGWIIGTGRNRRFFFRPEDTGWVLAPPDETLMGELHTVTADLFSLTYWDWDQAYVEDLLPAIDLAYQSTVSNFGLLPQQVAQFILMPELDDLLLPPEVDSQTAIMLRSPTAYNLYRGEKQSNELLFIATSITHALLRPYAGIYSTSRWNFVQALISWQMAQLAPEYGLEIPPEYFMWGEFWRPPDTVDSPDWLSLADLWQDHEVGMPATTMTQRPLQIQMVVVFTVEEYGPEKLPAMLIALDTAQSMGEWVAIVTGQPLDEFELAWRQWVIGRYQSVSPRER